eukprot:TRINITY_DN75451_c0_g1_i1.p1 TRINITY_DN75451_c0_g1~~TRINITY_DN75451_c0_g1_i1.p1  ORF type:complete len:391 (-),score=100.54 TRINITY_DN75451_c0_g1_i1:74-1246(-)
MATTQDPVFDALGLSAPQLDSPVPATPDTTNYMASYPTGSLWYSDAGSSQQTAAAAQLAASFLSEGVAANVPASGLLLPDFLPAMPHLPGSEGGDANAWSTAAMPALPLEASGQQDSDSAAAAAVSATWAQMPAWQTVDMTGAVQQADLWYTQACMSLPQGGVMTGAEWYPTMQMQPMTMPAAVEASSGVRLDTSQKPVPIALEHLTMTPPRKQAVSSGLEGCESGEKTSQVQNTPAGSPIVLRLSDMVAQAEIKEALKIGVQNAEDSAEKKATGATAGEKLLQILQGKTATPTSASTVSCAEESTSASEGDQDASEKAVDEHSGSVSRRQRRRQEKGGQKEKAGSAGAPALAGESCSAGREILSLVGVKLGRRAKNGVRRSAVSIQTGR